MDYPKQAESLGGISSSFTSTPGQVLLRHTERMKTPAIESGRYHRYYNKKSGRWSVYPCKEKTTYSHIRELIQKAFICRLEDTQGMRKENLRKMIAGELAETWHLKNPHHLKFW